MARAGDDCRLPSLAGAKWLIAPATRAVFAALIAEGAEARAVGGAVTQSGHRRPEPYGIDSKAHQHNQS